MVRVRPQRAAIDRSWVTSTSVEPRSRFSANISWITASPVAASRLPVGSSASSSGGSHTKARQRGQVRQQLEGLEYKADVLLAEYGAAVLVQLEDVGAFQFHRAAAGQVQARQEAQPRGFAGARGTDDGQRFASLHAEVDVVQDGQLAGGIGHTLAQLAYRDRGVARAAAKFMSVM